MNSNVLYKTGNDTVYSQIDCALKRGNFVGGLFATASGYLFLADQVKDRIPELWEKIKDVSFIRVVGSLNQFMTCGSSQTFEIGALRLALYRHRDEEKVRAVVFNSNTDSRLEISSITFDGVTYNALSICWYSKDELEKFKKSIHVLREEPSVGVFYTAGSDKDTLRLAIEVEGGYSSGEFDFEDTNVFG